MIRRPPRSTLFPTRRSSDLGTLVKGIWDDAVLLVPQALACLAAVLLLRVVWRRFGWGYAAFTVVSLAIPLIGTDRKSTRLNSSHANISYAVFCLKKKKILLI